MDKLEYKGYYGSIEYSKEDDCLFGKVLGMPNNLISYEGRTAADLYADFRDAIEFYLDYCQRSKIKPRKSFNGVLNIRIPSEVHGKIALYAQNNGTSINAFIRESIEKRLESIPRIAFAR
ncbi:MAG: type II toxin-antitoxin system HicB family antitoxin [Prevotellaceae bacterium]|jgi:predicted HicB family RNase H-like nuclease|nr:type II toxin-antitoxin system HicB family antitoxin [Prevotellaceae bacterium]